MITISISNSEVQELLAGEVNTYPKYTTQILVLANQNAQGTRPSIVGQMSDLIQEFNGNSLAEWREWYLERYPEAIDAATNRVFDMIEKLQEAISLVDKEMVKQWVEDLVIDKTFSGLKFQEVILKKIAIYYNKDYRLATKDEESQGIDGYIGEAAVSIKPSSYQAQQGLSEIIRVPIIFYAKMKSKIVIIFEEITGI